MHELGIVFHVFKEVRKIAEENGLTRVAAVTMEFGEVSGILTDYIADCWQWAAKKEEPPLRDAELKIETIPAVTFCGDCERTYETVRFGKTCPYCAGGNTWLLRGSEVNIKQIEGV